MLETVNYITDQILFTVVHTISVVLHGQTKMQSQLNVNISLVCGKIKANQFSAFPFNEIMYRTRTMFTVGSLGRYVSRYIG